MLNFRRRKINGLWCHVSDMTVKDKLGLETPRFRIINNKKRGYFEVLEYNKEEMCYKHSTFSACSDTRLKDTVYNLNYELGYIGKQDKQDKQDQVKEGIEMYKSKNVKMSNSEIMREAHRRAKTYEGDYQACFTLAIRELWREEKHGRPEEVKLVNGKMQYIYSDEVLIFDGGTDPIERIPRVIKDRKTQLIEAAIKRVLAGRARSRYNGYSGLDSIDDLSYLWQNSYKFDWHKDSDGNTYHAGTLLNSVNGDIYNECYIEGRKVLAKKNFKTPGQAVNYLALRFASRIRDHWQGYDSGKTTLQLKKERKGHYKSLDVQETRRKLEADVLQCHSVDDITEYIALNQDMKEVFTSKEIAAIKALAQGYTHRQIAKKGIASNRTIQKAKKKLYPWLKERIAQ